MKTVVFNSGGDAMTAFLGGHVDVMSSAPSTLMQQVKAGKVRALALGRMAKTEEWKKELAQFDMENVYRGSADTARYWKAEHDEVKGVPSELGLLKQ